MPPKKDQFKMTFDGIRVLNINFSTDQDFGEKGFFDINAQISLKHKYIEEQKKLLINLQVALPKGEAPFSFHVESVGTFTFQENPEKTTIERIARINCPAIMFPYSRELIADLTRRAGFPPLHIPPINFIALSAQSDKPENK